MTSNGLDPRYAYVSPETGTDLKLCLHTSRSTHAVCSKRFGKWVILTKHASLKAAEAQASRSEGNRTWGSFDKDAPIVLCSRVT